MDYLDYLVEQHRQALQAEDTELSEPWLTFWSLVRAGAELERQMAANDRYYASGRCGGCEVCGEPPHPEVPPDAAHRYFERMEAALEALKGQEVRTK